MDSIGLLLNGLAFALANEANDIDSTMITDNISFFTFNSLIRVGRNC